MRLSKSKKLYFEIKKNTSNPVILENAWSTHKLCRIVKGRRKTPSNVATVDRCHNELEAMLNSVKKSSLEVLWIQ